MNSKIKSKRKVGKKYINAAANIDHNKFYDINEAIKKIQDISFAKFDETLDISMNLGIDPRHSDQMVRGMASLPAGNGKKVKVAVICKEDKVKEALSAGADLAGLDIIESVKTGNIDFDVCIATPDVMGLMGQLARILGPKGLMPNPKLGTVTNAITSAVENAKNGQVEFRVDKSGIIHAGVGKLSFTCDQLESNVKALISLINKAKPTGAKGVYVKNIHLSSTMGPSVPLSTNNIEQI